MQQVRATVSKRATAISPSCVQGRTPNYARRVSFDPAADNDQPVEAVAEGTHGASFPGGVPAFKEAALGLALIQRARVVRKSGWVDCALPGSFS
jgi:hypothetical protein